MSEGSFLILQDPIIEYEKTVKNLQNTNTKWHTVVFYARAKLEKRFKIQRESQEILYHRKNQQPKFQFNHLNKIRLKKWMLLIQM